MKSNGYQFWFEADGGKTKLQLPVNPETLTVKRTANNSSVTVAGLGEVIVLNERSAIQISFSSVFPAHYFPGCSIKKPLFPAAYAMFFSSWMSNKKPVRFTVAKCGIVMYVTVESFQYSESGGDVGTYEYSLTLKEYRSARVRQINLE